MTAGDAEMGRACEQVHESEAWVSTWIVEYLADDCIFSERLFRRRFAVTRVVYRRIHDDLVDLNPNYWVKRNFVWGKGWEAVGGEGASMSPPTSHRGCL